MGHRSRLLPGLGPRPAQCHESDRDTDCAGQLDEASGLADDWDLSAPFSLVPVSPILLETRGLLRLANGDLADGVEDLLATGEDLEALGFVNPAASGWRQEVVPALASLGRVSKAAAIATEGETRARRFGTPRNWGDASRAGHGRAHEQVAADAHGVRRPAARRRATSRALSFLVGARRRPPAKWSET